jgi:cobaltochelatase CobS
MASSSKDTTNGHRFFVKPVWWPQLVSAVKAGFPVMLTGPAGSGKSTAIAELAATLSVLLHIAQGHPDMMVEELRGSLALRESSTVFRPGILTLSVQSGAWFLFEEVNLVRPGLSSFLNTVIDGTGIITVPETGEVVRVAEGFRAFFCLNDCGYAGTRELNAALKDRCRVIFCDYFPPDQEVRMLRGHLPYIAEVDAWRMIRTANAIREARRNGSTEFDMSMRSLIQWAYDAYDRSASLLVSFEDVILTKVGNPVEYAPQREALREAARVHLEE